MTTKEMTTTITKLGYRETVPPGGPLPHWAEKHNDAWNAGHRGLRLTMGSSVATMLWAWRVYADDYRAKYESMIGDDRILGLEWKKLGTALHDLLNGETGTLDCGTVSAWIQSTMNDHGMDFDE